MNCARRRLATSSASFVIPSTGRNELQEPKCNNFDYLATSGTRRQENPRRGAGMAESGPGQGEAGEEISRRKGSETLAAAIIQGRMGNFGI